MRKKRKPEQAVSTISAIDAAVKDLGHLPPEDWRVQRYATLMVAHSRIRNALADPNAAFDIDGLLKVETAMAELRATVPVKPIEVKIQIVNPTHCLCPSCGVEFEPPECGTASCPACGLRFVPESSDAVRERHAKAAVPDKPNGNGSAPSGSGIVAKPEAKAAPKPKPPEPITRDTGTSVSAFHSQEFPSGERPPIVRRNGTTPDHAGSLCWFGSKSGGGIPGGSIEADPNPNRSITGGPRENWKP